MRDGPSPRIFCLTPFASSFSSPTAASARGVRSTSSDAAPSPSANVDRRLMLAMIGLLLLSEGFVLLESDVWRSTRVCEGCQENFLDHAMCVVYFPSQHKR